MSNTPPSGPAAPRASAHRMSSHADVAHHIHEFGELEAGAVVHFAEPASQSADVPATAAAAAHPAPPHEREKKKKKKQKKQQQQKQQQPARRKTATSAIGKLFRQPTLQQFFYNDVLFRHKAPRAVSREELFLDLVLVAGIATLGHHLRAEPLSWPLVEKFLLLFGVVYAAWRHIVLLWNYWGVNEDMLDKLGVYFTFVFIFGISLGAYDPFGPTARPQVAVSAFLASFVPLAESFLWARFDPVLRAPANGVSSLTIGCILSTASHVPLLVAAFVASERTAMNLFWISLALQMASAILPSFVVRFLHRKNSRFSRPAISIEHAVEKFEVLTMIFMGEAVIALLSEGAPLIAKKGVQSGRLYLAGFLCTAMLYSFQTLYVQVDNRILRRGKHALRCDATRGFSWAALHMPYHLSLVLVATGLGLALRDVAFPPSAHGSSSSYPATGAAEAAAHVIVRAAAITPGVEQFTTGARWLFSVGWGAALIFSALLGATHDGGPRAASKTPRFLVRCAVAAGLLAGMPFANVSAIAFISVFAAVAAVLAVGELVLVQLDRFGLFRAEPVLAAAQHDIEAGPGTAEKTHSDDEAEDSGAEAKEEEGTAFADLHHSDGESSTGCEVTDDVTGEDMRRLENVLSSVIERRTTGAGDEEDDDDDMPEVVVRALQRRMTLGHASTLVRKQKSRGWYRRPHALG